MKHRLTIAVFAIISVLQLKAQSDFRNGYVVKNNHDTLYGLIDYRGNKANAKKCTFKKEINSELQTFTPNEIKSYRFITGKYYVSRLIPVGDTTEQLFLEYLINGIVDMYYYRGEMGEHYLVDNGEKLKELKIDEKEIKIDNKSFVKESKEYVGILRYLFKDSPSIAKKVDQVNLNHKSLIKITHDYHNAVCAGEECIIYEKALPKAKGTYGIVVGLNAVSIAQTGDFSEALNYLNNLHSPLNFFPSVGGYYKKNVSSVNEKLYFQYELTYSRMKLTTSSSYYEPIYSKTFLYDINMIQHSVNNLVFIKYEYPKGKVRPTFQAGYFINYFFSTNYIRDIVVKDNDGNVFNTNRLNESPFKLFDTGLNIGLGMKQKMFQEKEICLDVRYQRGFGFIRGLNLNYLSLNVGVQIGK